MFYKNTERKLAIINIMLNQAKLNIMVQAIIIDNSNLELTGQNFRTVLDGLSNKRAIGNKAQENNLIKINKWIRISIKKIFDENRVKSKLSSKQ